MRFFPELKALVKNQSLTFSNRCLIMFIDLESAKALKMHQNFLEKQDQILQIF